MKTENKAPKAVKTQKSPIEILLDENDDSNLILQKSDGGTLEFEQIAIIPKKGLLYAILRPITPIVGVQPDEAVLFKLKEGDTEFTLEEDDAIISEIFDEYAKLYEEEEKKVKAETNKKPKK